MSNIENEKKQDRGVYLVMSGVALIFGCWIIQIILNFSSNINQPFSEITDLVMTVGLILIGTGGFIIETSKKAERRQKPASAQSDSGRREEKNE